MFCIDNLSGDELSISFYTGIVMTRLNLVIQYLRFQLFREKLYRPLCRTAVFQTFENSVRYSIFLGRRHDSCWTHSPQTRSCNNMAVFWGYFRDFVGAQKIEDLSESKIFFAEVFQITSRFVVARKQFGVSCTLSPISARRLCHADEG